jgi:CheY-like chemotaxis protein
MTNLFDSQTVDILLAEDNPDDVKLLKTAMSISGWEMPFRIHVCSDGQKLLDYLIINPDKKVDVIVLDINMPCLDGIMTLKMIRKHPKWHHLPVILYSSIESKKGLQQCFQAGGDDFFEKPFDPRGYMGLAGKIQTLLSKRMQKSANAA